MRNIHLFAILLLTFVVLSVYCDSSEVIVVTLNHQPDHPSSSGEF